MEVNLNDILECFEFENEYVTYYYNRKNGIINYIQDEEVSEYRAEFIDVIEEYEEYEQEIIKSIYDFKTNKEDYIRLPHIDEEVTLKKFCENNNLNFVNDLHNLKKSINDNNLINEWYDFLEAIEKQSAIDWCLNNNIKYYID